MGLDRRSFISFVTGGVAGTLFTPVIWKGLDDVSIWSQNWPWIPTLTYGAEEKVPALCKLGSDAYGITVRKIAGNPVSAEGSDHPLSRGGICPLGAAAVQLLYSPSRTASPMKRTENGLVPISWDEGLALLAEKLKTSGKDTVLISGDDTGSATEVLAGLVRGLGSDKTFLMPGDGSVAVKAVQEVFGATAQVGYDLENASHALILGADAMTSWGTAVANARALAGGGAVYAGPAQNGTSAAADTWVPCKAGQEGALALCIAAVLLESGAVRTDFLGFREYRNFVLTNYAPRKAAELTGVSEKVVRRLAADLARAARPVVVIGSGAGQGMGVFETAAGLSLNLLLGRVNTSGGMKLLPVAPTVVKGAPSSAELAGKDLVGYLAGVQSGKESAPAVVLAYEANPAYALPQGAAKGLQKAGFLVSFSPFMDETAAMADLVLPAPYMLERLDDAYTPFGSARVSYTVAEPVLDPLKDCRSTPDVALALAGELGIDLGFSSFARVLKARAKSLGAKWSAAAGGSAWTSDKVAALSGLSLWNKRYRLAAPPENLTLVPVAQLKVGSARMATVPFATITIREDELLGKEFFVQMNGATARRHDLAENDLVTLKSAAGSCTARVNVFEGVMTDVVIAPLGFGHTAWDDFSKGKGENVYDLLGAASEPDTGASLFSTAQVSVTRA
jgi:anaerobic selenocysteine-containing dehydrogenase